MSKPPTSHEILPVLLAVAEHADERIRDVDGPGWATLFGLTLGDATRIVSGRNWSSGAGAWRVPRGSHPAPLALDVYLMVCSEDFVLGGRYPWLAAHRPLFQARLSKENVAAHVQAQISAIGSCNWDELLRRLRPHFHVEET